MSATFASASAATADWVVVPSTPPEIEAVARQCRRMVTKNALLAAGVAVVPIPGIDWLTDIGVLMKLLPRINAAFGLSPEQVERLSPERRVVVYKVLSAAGGVVAGRLLTRDLLMLLLRKAGVRLSTQQVAKFLPIAGQAISAALTFSALRYVAEQHIRQCMDVCRQLQLPAPPVQSASHVGV
jgi:uncharacterized protein (DUF697 family)